MNEILLFEQKLVKIVFERFFFSLTIYYSSKGNQIEAGSTTPIHIQLFDNQKQSSEDIRLKHQDHDKHNFEPAGN